MSKMRENGPDQEPDLTVKSSDTQQEISKIISEIVTKIQQVKEGKSGV